MMDTTGYLHAIDRWVFDFQHWITTLGLILTLAGLLLGYRKAMNQIRLFKAKARSQILAEKVALSKAWTEELIARVADADLEFKRFRLGVLRETLMTARDMLDQNHSDLHSKIGAVNLSILDIEKLLVMHSAGGNNDLSTQSYVDVLFSLRELIFEIDSASRILSQEVENGAN